MLLILMIALLPLRSWALVAEPSSPHSAPLTALDKVATQAQPLLLSSQFTAKTTPEHPCHSASSGTPEDVAQPTLVKHPTYESTCSTCGDCALCHSLVTTAAPLLSSPTLFSHWLRPKSGDRFDSALAALSFKPPIA